MISNEYWAGLFDGEGSVSISNTLRPRATISQNKTEILYAAQKRFGGHVFSKGDTSNCSNWVVAKAEEVEDFLWAVFPYSIIKREEIDIALKVASMIRKQNKGCHPLPIEEKSQRLAYRRQLQKIKCTKRFEDRPSSGIIYRENIKKNYDYKCCICGMDLRGKDFYSIIEKNEKLYCRKCHTRVAVRSPKKPISKEQIEKALKLGVKKAAKALGASRATLYQKRKKFGLEIKLRG